MWHSSSDKRSRSGLTLIELLVVVTILALLATVAITATATTTQGTITKVEFYDGTTLLGSAASCRIEVSCGFIRLRPTWSDPLARPRGWRSLAERSRITALLTAPAASTT